MLVPHVQFLKEILAWPAGGMYRSFPYLYSYCACIIAQCVLCMYHCTMYTVPVPFVHVCVCDFFPFMLNIKFVEGFSHSFLSSSVKSNFVY